MTTPEPGAGPNRQEVKDLLRELFPYTATEHGLGERADAILALFARHRPAPVAKVTAMSERAALVADVGECCRGGDPLCAGGCLVEIALKKRIAPVEDAEIAAIARYHRLVNTGEGKLTPEERVEAASLTESATLYMLQSNQHRATLLDACQAQDERHEHNVTKPLDADPVCVGCGGPHPFDTTIPSVTWNRVVRANGLPDYLCLTCIVRAFAKTGEGFTAELWGEDFHGLPIELSIASRTANSSAETGDENTRLRVEAREQRERAEAAEVVLQAAQATIAQWGMGDDITKIRALEGQLAQAHASTTRVETVVEAARAHAAECRSVPYNDFAAEQACADLEAALATLDAGVPRV